MSMRVCLQWTLIVFNTLSVILGILAIVACCFELEKYQENSTEYGEKILQIVVASALVVSAFVGCCGAVYGSIAVLSVFVIMLMGLVAAHGWMLWHYNEPKKNAQTEMMVTYTWIEELVKAGAMDALQQAYECCGKKGRNDYSSSRLRIPDTCYPNGDTSQQVFGEGCTPAIRRSYLKIYRYEKWANWGLGGFEIFGIFLSFVLMCKLSTKTRRYRY